jgi:hypothetical protein
MDQKWNDLAKANGGYERERQRNIKLTTQGYEGELKQKNVDNAYNSKLEVVEELTS